MPTVKHTANHDAKSLVIGRNPHQKFGLLGQVAHSQLLPFALALLLFGLNVLPHQAAQAKPASQEGQSGTGKASAQVTQALQTQGTAQVIVNLVDPASITADSATRSQSMQIATRSVLAGISGADFKTIHEYSHVPTLSGVADARAIAALEANPLVASIQLDEPIEASLAESVPAVGADVVHNTYGYTGKNVRVAVLDTGVRATHHDLAGDIFAQHCFSSFGDCPNGTFEGPIATDGNGHGTNVTGIITSDGVVSSVGFAPDAQVAVIRVLNEAGNGYLSDALAGLDWIIANESTLQIKIINMSLGSATLYSGNCDSSWPQMASAMTQLHNLGVTVFVASGNSASSTQLSSPACHTYVVAVGATYDANVGGLQYSNCLDSTTALNKITCFTNAGTMLDILAPGALITSDGRLSDTDLLTEAGTSQASPSAAGVAALLLEAWPVLTPDQLEAKLKATGLMLTAPRLGGRSYPRINALAAIKSLTPTQLMPNTATITDSTPTFSWTAVVDATKYEVRLGTNNPPTTVVFSANALTYTPVTPMLLGTYYWQVRAVNAVTASAWSAVKTFTLASPIGGAPSRNYFNDPTPTLTWNRVSWAVRYDIQVSKTPTFTGVPIVNVGNALEYTPATALTDGNYYWHVRACSATACNPWSATDTFSVVAP